MKSLAVYRRFIFTALVAVVLATSLFGIQTAGAAPGDLVYATQLSGTGTSLSRSVKTDVSGNVYTVGGFTGTIDFDPGVGTVNLTSAGQEDIFISKLDSNGNFVFAKQIGSTTSDIALSIAIDANGDLIISGGFTDTADFDPGAGTSNLTSVAMKDVFILKLENDGTFVYAKSLGGSSDDDSFSVTTDGSNNVYAAGLFESTVDFDPGAGTANLTSAGNSDSFIVKLDVNGDYVFAKRMGGISVDNAYGITIDGVGNIITIGNFALTADFDPGAGTANLTTPGTTDTYISKLDSSGNYIFAKQLSGSGTTFGFNVVIDSSNNIYGVGQFDQTTDFDPGVGVSNMTSNGTNDAYIIKLSSSGNYVYAKQIGGTLGDVAFSIGIDPAGNVHYSGAFTGTVDFDPGAGIANMTSNGSSDGYILELDSNGNYVNVKQLGGTGVDVVFSLAFDALGNSYGTGAYSGTVDFDPGAGISNLTSIGSSSVFILMLEGNPIIVTTPSPPPSSPPSVPNTGFDMTSSASQPNQLIFWLPLIIIINLIFYTIAWFYVRKDKGFQ